MSLVHNSYEVGGCDISFYQHPINWDVFAPKMNFLIIRAGDGIGNQEDVRFDEYWAEARRRKIPRGSYWFFRPEIDPVDQARRYLAAFSSSSDMGELGLYIDLEVNKTNMPRRDVSKVTKVFMQSIEEEIRNNPIKYVGIYTSAGFWNTHIDPSMIPNLYDRKLWVAQWVNNPVRPTALPSGWSKWDFWQFSATAGLPIGQAGNGKTWGVYSHGLDMNVFNGDVNKFKMDFRLGTTVITDTGKLPDLFMPKPGVNIRSAPSETTYPVIGTLSGSAAVPVLDKKTDNQGRVWYLIAKKDKIEWWIASWLGSAI